MIEISSELKACMSKYASIKLSFEINHPRHTSNGGLAKPPSLYLYIILYTCTYILYKYIYLCVSWYVGFFLQSNAVDTLIPKWKFIFPRPHVIISETFIV